MATVSKQPGEGPDRYRFGTVCVPNGLQAAQWGAKGAAIGQTAAWHPPFPELPGYTHRAVISPAWELGGDTTQTHSPSPPGLFFLLVRTKKHTLPALHACMQPRRSPADGRRSRMIDGGCNPSAMASETISAGTKAKGLFSLGIIITGEELVGSWVVGYPYQAGR